MRRPATSRSSSTCAWGPRRRSTPSCCRRGGPRAPSGCGTRGPSTTARCSAFLKSCTESAPSPSAWCAHARAEPHPPRARRRLRRPPVHPPQPIDWFADKIGRHRNCLRAINYPEQRHAPTPGQLRASTHTDYGALTILRLGGAHPGGLQALGLGGEWVAVQDASDGFVINLGDLMARWTNDRWLSTPHRVVNPADGEAARARRQSLAYFVNVNMDADIECIPTCHGDEGSKYPTIKAGEHLLTKHQQTVAGKLCYEAAASSSSAAADRSSTPTPTPMDAEAASATPTPMR